MNNTLNSSINTLINEKHLAKSIARSSKFKQYILDLNFEQFSYKYGNFPKRLKIKIRKKWKKRWKKRFKVRRKLFSKKSIFFIKETFNYFMRRKRNLKFLFLKNIAKTKKPKYKNILYNIKHFKSKGLIAKPLRKGFKVYSNRIRGFIHKKALTRIIKRFKIQLLRNSQKLTNSMYLSNLHNLRQFIFHKLTLVRKNDKYGNFRIFGNKYNRKRRRRILKIKNRIELKSRIKLRRTKKKKLKHEKKINTKKKVKKNNKQKYIKKENYTKRSKKVFANKQKQFFTKQTR